MQFIGCKSIDEVIGKRIGVLIKTSNPEIQSITAEIFMRDGIAMIDCIPTLKKKHTIEIPDDALIAASDDPKAPWPFAVFVGKESKAGLFITSLLKSELPFRN